MRLLKYFTLTIFFFSIGQIAAANGFKLPAIFIYESNKGYAEFSGTIFAKANFTSSIEFAEIGGSEQCSGNTNKEGFGVIRCDGKFGRILFQIPKPPYGKFNGHVAFTNPKDGNSKNAIIWGKRKTKSFDDALEDVRNSFRTLQ